MRGLVFSLEPWVLGGIRDVGFVGLRQGFRGRMMIFWSDNAVYSKIYCKFAVGFPAVRAIRAIFILK